MPVTASASAASSAPCSAINALLAVTTGLPARSAVSTATFAGPSEPPINSTKMSLSGDAASATGSSNQGRLEMSNGRGRLRDRAETPVTAASRPTGEKPGRSLMRLSRPAPTVPRPATPMRQGSFLVMGARLSRLRPATPPPLAPIQRAWRRHHRMAAFLDRPIGPGPEETRVTVVLATDAHGGRIEPRHQPSVDRIDPRRLVLGRQRMGDAAAGAAAMELEIAVQPRVGFGDVWRGTADQLHRIGSVEVAPEAAVPPAERAIAVEHPLRRLGELEADRFAMAGCPDHFGVSSISRAALRCWPDCSRNFFTLRAAWRMRCSFSTRPMRT